MATITLRTIDLNTQFKDALLFPVDKTLIGLLQIKLKSNRKGVIDAFIEDLKARFPKATEAINNKVALEEVESDLKKMRGGILATDTLMIKCFNYFNTETDILNEAKPATIEQVSELLKEQSTDNEAVKILKAVASGEVETYKAIFESWEAGGVAGLIFATDSIKNFYLDYLPNTYIKDHLNKDPVITIGELNQDKLKEIVNDIFAVFYSGFTNLEQQDDLNDFQKGINDNLDKLKTLITETRASKKPIEPEKPVEKPQDPQELTDLKNELTELYAYIDGLLDRQSQRPVYILTEEPEQMKREGGKPNPNYTDFEEELTKHPLIKDKIQERINKRKFSTPIEISKPKPTPEQPQPSNEQISKANQYDNIASIFPNGKIPDNLKELWTNLNQRPNITQEELNNLKNQLQQQGIKPEELKLLLKDNWEYLKGHIDALTNIIKKAVPTTTQPISSSSSSSTSESKPSSSDSTTKP